MAVTVLLIRHAPHAQLGATLSGRTAGLGLTADGVEQATRLGVQLGAQRLDGIQASPLDRTMQTAHAIAAAAGLGDVDAVPALNEIDFGEWTGRRFADLAGDPRWEVWNAARCNAAPPDGENMAAAQARIVAHLRATAHAHDGETIAMVTHCDMIRAAVAWIIGLPLDNLLRFDVDPASVTRVVLGDWGGRLLTLNEGYCR